MISVTCPRTPDDSLIAAWCGKDKNNITDAERDSMKFLIVEQLRQAISLIVFQWQHFQGLDNCDIVKISSEDMDLYASINELKHKNVKLFPQWDSQTWFFGDDSSQTYQLEVHIVTEHDEEIFST